MSPDAVFERALPTFRILWSVLVGFTLVLVGVVLEVSPQVDKRHPFDPKLEVILFAAAAAIAIASFVLPWHFMGQVARSLGEMVIPASPVAPARFREPLPVAQKAVAVGLPALIVTLSLCEAVSLIGLCLHMLGAPMAHVLPIMAAGTLLAALRFPTAGRIAGALERAAGARFADSVVAR
jgi:hypothetical protein